MGLTWLFGFLANIPGLWPLWYVFIVLNTLQGVMIFVAFVMNARVLQMYRKFFYKSEVSASGGSASTGSTGLKSRMQSSIKATSVFKRTSSGSRRSGSVVITDKNENEAAAETSGVKTDPGEDNKGNVENENKI